MKVQDDEPPKLVLYSKKKIHTGEELRYPYDEDSLRMWWRSMTQYQRPSLNVGVDIVGITVKEMKKVVKTRNNKRQVEERSNEERSNEESLIMELDIAGIKVEEAVEARNENHCHVEERSNEDLLSMEVHIAVIVVEGRGLFG